MLAEEFTRRIIARWGEPLDLWQLPTLSISLAREHEWAPGTMSLSIQGMTAFMRDLGREIARALPARNLAIINGHGGNRGILEALAQDLRADFGLNVCVLHPAEWAEIDANAAIPEIHGGKNETSMMLAIAPQSGAPRPNRAIEKSSWQRGDPRRRSSIERCHGPGRPTTSGSPTWASSGTRKAASAEFGERLLGRVIEAAGGVLKKLSDQQRPIRR